jgi:hypothetical protein
MPRTRTTSKPGPKRKLTPRDERFIRRLATSAPNSSLRSIARAFKARGVVVSKDTVRRSLRRFPVKYGKACKKRKLSLKHRRQRKLWVKNIQSRSRHSWREISFTDEKRWTLDGPDGCSSHWYNTKSGPRPREKRVAGGGGIMVWGGISSKGCTSLHMITTRMKATDYINVLTETLLPVGRRLGGRYWQLCQDGARCHTAKLTRKFLKERKVSLLQLPPRSPDLNPIENIWGILSNKVYAGGIQYGSVDQLRNAVLCAWKSIDRATLRKLVLSMPTRLDAVLHNRGASIPY